MGGGKYVHKIVPNGGSVNWYIILIKLGRVFIQNFASMGGGAGRNMYIM